MKKREPNQMNNNIIEKEISHADFETSGPTHIKKVYSSSKEKKNQTANKRENFDRLSKKLPADKRKFTYGSLNANNRPVTPPRGTANKNKKK
uniref:(California timema) hypothetical protein n=1 Tax=Timema californicum TaxID=61474 RepID=A0A7R9P9T2_TIMCA|nr:unnamed protein product [Timema californicum]